MTPAISVVIPAFNALRFLPGAVENIRAQGVDNVEIVLVDDGSTDGTAEWAACQDGVRLICQSNAGPSSARNRGIDAAHGACIAFLDADDRWPDYKLRVQLDWLQARPELEVAIGRVRWISLDGSKLPEFAYTAPDQAIAFVNLGAAVWRRTAFEKAGRFDESLRYAEDHDWYLRARECGLPMVILRDITLDYRVHAANMTAGKSGNELGFITALRRSLERRRARGMSTPLAPWSSYEELTRPDVSVVIPVYNGARYLAQAIASALAQTVRPLEVLVVDDGSTDESASVAERFGAPVRVLQTPHAGAGAARNAGCGAARGSLLAFLDADDLWLPEKLARQIDKLRANEQSDIAYTLIEPFDDTSGSAGQPHAGVLPSACLFRRSVWTRTGPFLTSLHAGEFIDWMARAREAGLREATVEEVLVRRRIHESNMTRPELRQASDYARVARAALERRRRRAGS